MTFDRTAERRFFMCTRKNKLQHELDALEDLIDQAMLDVALEEHLTGKSDETPPPREQRH